jgi:membrane protein
MAIERSGCNPTQRGVRHASPQDISARGRTAILLFGWRRSNAKNIALVAGGVTFYVIMALAPGVASLISVYGLFANPHQTERRRVMRLNLTALGFVVGGVISRLRWSAR